MIQFSNRFDSSAVPMIACAVALSLLTGLPAHADATDDDGKPLGLPLDAFSFYIGRWGPPPDAPILKERPEFASHVAFEWEWGPRRRAVRSFEVPQGKREEAVVEGLITWNPTDGRIVYLEAQTKDNFLFRGEYTVGPGNHLTRTYEVSYPIDYAPPRPEWPGRVRRFREIFRPSGPDHIEVQLDAYDFGNGGWAPWGRFGGTYALQRIPGRAAHSIGDGRSTPTSVAGFDPTAVPEIPDEALRRMRQLLGVWNVKGEVLNAEGDTIRSIEWQNHGEWVIEDRVLLLTHNVAAANLLSKAFVFYDDGAGLYRLLDVNQKGESWSLFGRLDEDFITSEPHQTGSGEMIVRFTHEDLSPNTLVAMMDYSLDGGATWVRSQRQTLTREID